MNTKILRGRRAELTGTNSDVATLFGRVIEYATDVNLASVVPMFAMMGLRPLPRPRFYAFIFVRLGGGDGSASGFTHGE